MRTQLIKGLPDRDFELAQVFNIVYLIWFGPKTAQHDTNKYEKTKQEEIKKKHQVQKDPLYRNLPCISEILSCRILA